MKALEQLREAREDLIDLQKEYDRYNQLLFDSRLPQIKLRWMRSKRKGGHAKALKYQDGTIEIKELALSNFWLREPDEYRAILVHEMVHIEQFVNGRATKYDRQAHGHAFKARVRELSQRLGMDIPIVDSEIHDVADKTEKLQDVLIRCDRRSCYILVAKANTLEGYMEELEEYFQYVANYKRETLTIDIVQSSNPELQQYPIKRKPFNKVSMGGKQVPAYKVSPELLSSLRNSGKTLVSREYNPQGANRI